MELVLCPVILFNTNILFFKFRYINILAKSSYKACDSYFEVKYISLIYKYAICLQ